MWTMTYAITADCKASVPLEAGRHVDKLLERSKTLIFENLNWVDAIRDRDLFFG